jgi:hypothetical protein
VMPLLSMRPLGRLLGACPRTPRAHRWRGRRSGRGIATRGVRQGVERQPWEQAKPEAGLRGAGPHPHSPSHFSPSAAPRVPHGNRAAQSTVHNRLVERPWDDLWKTTTQGVAAAHRRTSLSPKRPKSQFPTARIRQTRPHPRSPRRSEATGIALYPYLWKMKRSISPDQVRMMNPSEIQGTRCVPQVVPHRVPRPFHRRVSGKQRGWRSAVPGEEMGGGLAPASARPRRLDAGADHSPEPVRELADVLCLDVDLARPLDLGHEPLAA